MSGKIYIGTSGWHYKHWLGLYYPQELPTHEMLSFYANDFDTVEINNTFYHLPAASTFDNWRTTTQKQFVFAVKGSRFITHMKKLKDPRSATAKFFAGAERLDRKLGPILFQLPPRWRVNLERLESFLAALPKEHRYSFEFRDPSWEIAEVFELLRKHKAAFCIHDLGGKQTPLELTADFTYVRFHGPGEAKYAGSYSTRALKKWAERIREWQRKLARVYIYFNNDVGGHAVNNAKKLKELVSAS